jgi:hypothetical protein
MMLDDLPVEVGLLLLDITLQEWYTPEDAAAYDDL